MMSKRSFSAFLLHIHPRSVPDDSARTTFTWCLGGLALWFFVLEAISGALLMLHYVPSAGGAYSSVQEITHVVPYGFFVRNLHYWGGQIMVWLVGLHMIRVFVTGSYQAPRRLNWILGLSLFPATLVLDFTGYLLVWDDRGMWAWTIARNLAASVPYVGPFVASALFGSAQGGDAALVRLYAWHVFLLPGAMVPLMTWHFWRIRRDGMSRPL